ncbi:MAG: FtsH protease activity modulator HflK [Rhodanobacter sp.]|nr:FtsH protease activity modulator HflK [Rhodanobacter sp.]
MAWNEPGSGKQRDPWRDSGGGPPFDIDALVKRVREFFKGLLGGRGGSSGSGGGGGVGVGGIGIAVVGILVGWVALDSFVRIPADETGVVLRFGQFQRLMTPGLNIKIPYPIESVIRVNVGNVRQTNDQVRMLTQDENIVLVDFNVQYQVADSQAFAFGVRDPDATLGQAAESAVRTVIGGSDMDTILSGQRTELMAEARKLLQASLDQYGTGITLTGLNFQNVRPPPEVKDAFDEANRALQDKQRAEEEAKAYASQVVPEARGDAAGVRAEAAGYKAERIARAEGDAQRFSLIQAQYKAAPDVTRKRLYLETVQQVVARMPKIIDFSSGKNIISLPTPAAEPPPLPPKVAAAAAANAPEPNKGGR